MPHVENWPSEELPGGWVELNDRESGSFKRELKKEIARKHPLFGRGLTPVAKCRGCDEILVDITNELTWALVHVTWRRALEKAPSPVTTVLGQALPYDEMVLHAEGCG